MDELMEEVASKSVAVDDSFKIKEGDYAILKGGSVLSTCQVLVRKKANFKKKKFFLDNAIGCHYGSTFKINDIQLELVPQNGISEFDEELDATELKDNRDLNDDGKSQKLSRDDIENLKEKGLSGEEIVDQLVENSQTFKDKNEYSKIKYLKKKKLKYSNIVTILKPTTRLLIELYHTQGFLKILGLRMDSLAQILTFSNLCAGGKFIVVDSCLGLVTGAILERLGGLGKLVNVYTGNIPNYPTLSYFNLSEKQRQCLVYADLNDLVNASDTLFEDINNVPVKAEEESEREQRKRQRESDKKDVLKLMDPHDFDSIILASKQHPVNILRSLIPYLSLSRPFVVYSPYQQPLIECYVQLKEDGNILYLNLSETWSRHYQVLPNRTHPLINGSGGSGYLLTGIKAEKNSWK